MDPLSPVASRCDLVRPNFRNFHVEVSGAANPGASLLLRKGYTPSRAEIRLGGSLESSQQRRGGENEIEILIGHPTDTGFPIEIPRPTKLLIFLAHRGGFEPPTPRFVVWCSIQLSYRCVGRGVIRGKDGMQGAASGLYGSRGRCVRPSAPPGREGILRPGRRGPHPERRPAGRRGLAGRSGRAAPRRGVARRSAGDTGAGRRRDVATTSPAPCVSIHGAGERSAACPFPVGG